MSRRPTDRERALVLKLIGADFAEMDVLQEQLSATTVAELESGAILEFNPVSTRPFASQRRVLGEGSLRDIDGTPIVFTLLQRDGYIWRLDMGRADSARIQRSIDVNDIVVLGHGQGLSLEQN
jgi:hypothetical protein